MVRRRCSKSWTRSKIREAASIRGRTPITMAAEMVLVQERSTTTTDTPMAAMARLRATKMAGTVLRMAYPPMARRIRKMGSMEQAR